MKGKMKVAVMNGIRDIGFTLRDIPTPTENEVLVRINHVGICGSDLHYFQDGRIGDHIVRPPFVLGHEAAGTVVETGSNVQNLKPGDRVALEPGKTCGRCEFCRSGRYNLCPDVIFFATPPVDGVFQEYAVHDAALCFKLPDGMSTLEGALIEPLAVGFHAACLGNARIGQTAVVTGAGCIGLVSMMALKAMGVSPVYVSDVMPNRLKKAAELGASAVIDAAAEDMVQAVLRRTEGAGCDLVIETSGVEASVQQAVRMAKKGSTIVIVGYNPKDTVCFPMNLALDKELTIRTIFRYRHIYPMAIEAVASGRVNLKGLVTNLFEFDRIQQAMEQSVDRKAEIVKAAIRIS